MNLVNLSFILLFLPTIKPPADPSNLHTGNPCIPDAVVSSSAKRRSVPLAQASDARKRTAHAPHALPANTTCIKTAPENQTGEPLKSGNPKKNFYIKKLVILLK